jgi:hypothetical protein
VGTTLYTVTVDTEEEWDWSAGWPVQDLKVTNIYELPAFQELCASHGAAVTYFTNKAVFDDLKARNVILDLARRPDVEIGMHIHPWNTTPVNDQPVTPRQTFLHNLQEESVTAKLTSVHDCFLDNGLRPTSFRGGRYSCGQVAQLFLRDKGFLVDASIVPYTTWDDEGAPDYRQRDLTPCRLPPRIDGDTPLWEVPLTMAFTRRPFSFWARCYEFVQNTPLRKLRLIGIAERLGVVRKVWLNFEEPLGERMLDLLFVLRRLALPCICFTVHSSSLVVGKGPYTRTPADKQRLFKQLEDVLQTLAGWPEFRPATITDVARKLEERYHACTGNQSAR